MKTCSTCKILKQESEFYKDKRTPDGLKYQCKTCHVKSSVATRNKDKKRKLNREFMRKSRASNPEKFRIRESNYKRNKDQKYIARILLNCAVKRGDIIKPEYCEQCGSKNRLTAHHEDYRNALEVRWLCYECHGKQHRKVS